MCKIWKIVTKKNTHFEVIKKLLVNRETNILLNKLFFYFDHITQL